MQKLTQKGSNLDILINYHQDLKKEKKTHTHTHNLIRVGKTTAISPFSFLFLLFFPIFLILFLYIFHNCHDHIYSITTGWTFELKQLLEADDQTQSSSSSKDKSQ